jgi:hypothetical protein
MNREEIKFEFEKFWKHYTTGSPVAGAIGINFNQSDSYAGLTNTKIEIPTCYQVTKEEVSELSDLLIRITKLSFEEVGEILLPVSKIDESKEFFFVFEI